eukprot:GHUV01032636.1.p1 GENE.GHUV01032636.1~~GHUV01032636.1.p1  ORF type:complete len:158 (-),score=18.70 GHUV01032636.1:661-1134(-)
MSVMLDKSDVAALHCASKLLTSYSHLLHEFPAVRHVPHCCRWVVINKDPTRAGTATLKLTKNLGYTPTAKVLRLVAPGDNPLSATTGITLAGVTYGNGGVPRGTRKVEQIDVVADGSGLKLTLYMPPASAALVRLPKAGWVAGGAAGSQAVARQPEP